MKPVSPTEHQLEEGCNLSRFVMVLGNAAQVGTPSRPAEYHLPLGEDDLDQMNTSLTM